MTSHPRDVIAAFSEDQVQRLAGLSRRRLRYWYATGFFKPAFTTDDRPAPRFYAFEDLVALRTIRVLLT